MLALQSALLLSVLINMYNTFRSGTCNQQEATKEGREKKRASLLKAWL
jgi:hypothetical protein